MSTETTWRDDGATMPCPVCGRRVAATGRRRFCCDTCRKTAWRRRHQPPSIPVVVPAPGRPRRPITVYECENCDVRQLGQQRCDGCGAFMRRIGVGGVCPHCDGPVAVADLVDEHTTTEEARA